MVCDRRNFVKGIAAFGALGGWRPFAKPSGWKHGGIDPLGDLGDTGKESFLKDRDGAEEIAKRTGTLSRQGMVVNVYDDMEDLRI